MFETFPIPKLLEIVKVSITYPEGRGVTEKSDHNCSHANAYAKDDALNRGTSLK